MSTLRSSLFAILAILIALGAIEGIAWWWMHPAPAGLGQPVLAYRPVGRDPARSAHLSPAARDDHDQPPGVGDQEAAPALPQDPTQSSSSNLKSKINNHQSEISPSSSPIPNLQSQISNHSTFTPLPEVYQKAAPMLRCSSGQVFHVQIHDTAGLHGAFFEWDGTDTGSVLEAFRHMPEACMGSIGMELVSREKPIPYTVDGQTLLFDHTVFRDPAQGGGSLAPDPLVHAFRAVWVAGMSSADARQGLDGRKFDQLRAIRLKAALTRFRPTHARVIQGAIRGIANPDRAWEIFEESMLHDLAFQR